MTARVQVSIARAIELAENLGALWVERGGELRWELRGGWTLFFRLREDYTLALASHPEPGQWVGTLAMSENHLTAWIDQLASAQAGTSQ